MGEINLRDFIMLFKAYNTSKISIFFYFFIGLGIFFSSYLFASQDISVNIAPSNMPSKIEHYVDSKTGIFDEDTIGPEKVSDTFAEYRRVPILIYHYIREEKSSSDLVIPKHRFREQMKYLKDNNYTTITLDELYTHFKDGTLLPQKPVVITVDDGDKELFVNVFPILKEFNLKATFFVITGRIDKHPKHLSSQELITLQENGIDIESHTVHHEKLDDLTYAHQLATLQNSKAVLERLLKKEVKHIAYPYGAYNYETLKAVRDAGYKTAVSGIRELAAKTNGLYELHRIYIGRADGMQLFKKVLNGDFSVK